MLMEKDGALEGWMDLPVWAINAAIIQSIPEKRMSARTRPAEERTVTGTINSSVPGGVIAQIMNTI